MTNIPDLHTMKFAATFHKTMFNAEGNKIDMYLLHDDESGDGLVSIGVPHGREDIIDVENFKP